MTPDLRRLTQFTAVAEELHFGRAAKRLHMTQPALTQAIQALEAGLGAQLLARSRRSVALTAAGTVLLDQSRRLLADAQALPARVRAAAEGFSGVLRLAFVSSIAYGPLPGWLRGFREAHADVQLQLREATLDVQLAAFEADEIDAGFVLHAPAAVPAGFAAHLALVEPLVLALPEGHPALQPGREGQKARRLPSLLAEPLVIYPRGIAPSLFDAVIARYRAHGQSPRIVQEAIQMQTLVNLVSVGMGVAWVPASVSQLQRPGVAYLPVPAAALQCETSLIWREPASPAGREPASPVLQRFVSHVAAAPARAVRLKAAA